LLSHGGHGGPFEAPGKPSNIEARHGSAAARPSAGGFGGPFEAPHQKNNRVTSPNNGSRIAPL